MWGFDEEVRRMVFSCLSTVKYTLLVNGNQVGTVEPRRGLRQGDPLSPYLFIICAEVLSRLAARDQSIQGIKISNHVPPISHILFADDILFMSRANAANAKAIAGIIEQFCVGSGQLVSKDKSHIFFSKNTNPRTRKEIKCILGIKDLKNGTIYLGNSLVVGRNKTKEFGRLKEKVQARLEGWQAQLLSKAGKATLIRSVVQAIPVDTFSTFKVPIFLCNDIDCLVRKFWWSSSFSNSGIAWKSWKSLCTPLDQGGLGFKSFKNISIALITKLGRRIAVGDNAL